MKIFLFLFLLFFLFADMNSKEISLVIYIYFFVNQLDNNDTLGNKESAVFRVIL